MSPPPPTQSSCVSRSFFGPSGRTLCVTGLLALVGCGGITCPEPLSNVDGMCLKLDSAPLVEVCDGVDNDGDSEVDEDWPTLGEGCGEGGGRGECVEGRWACAAGGQGLVCEGVVGPVAEVCDGKDNDCDGTPDNGPDEVCDGEDNDCDGFVDEGVLSVKSELFDDRATVTAVDGGFVVARVVGERVRVETYDTQGEPSGALDTIDNPASVTTFITSSSSGRRVLVSLGKHSFYVLDIDVDASLVPVIESVEALHEAWDQPQQLGIYRTPYHPRVLASPFRFIGYPDLGIFALTPFSGADLGPLAEAPTPVEEFPRFEEFDAAGPYVVWNEVDNLRGAWLLDDGSFLFEIDVARGESPGVAIGIDGPAVAYLQDGELLMSELGAGTLLCRNGGFCHDDLDDEALTELDGPTALAYDEAADKWFVGAGGKLAVVGRSQDGPVVHQVEELATLRDIPRRVEVAVSGGTSAVVHAEWGGQTGLTFLGCF